MARGHKQFFVECYEIVTLANGCPVGVTRTIGNASSLKTAKAIISKYRRSHQDRMPQDFKVFDCWADVDADTNFVPCVHSEI